MDLRFDKTAGGLAVVHRVFLQFAFASLVADRAVEGVIDKQKLQHAFAHLLHTGCVRVDFHAGRNWRGAGDYWARRFRNLQRTVGIQNWFAVRAERGCAILDEAHAAVARNGQLRMIAIMRHIHLRQLAGLDHRGRDRLAGNRVGHRLRHLNFAPVHFHLDLFHWWRGLRFSCGYD